MNRPRRPAVRITIVVLLAIVLLGAAAGVLFFVFAQDEQHPTESPHLAVFSDTLAAENAVSSPEGSAEQEAAAHLAEVPTAAWLVPERVGIGSVDAHIAELTKEARTQDAVATVVVYGMPGRDCGNHSAGGLSPRDYDTWTAEIGEALRASDVPTILILEPDGIALSNECGNAEERAEQLQSAVENLSGENIDIYIDGGHSTWHSPELMAEMIRSMGLIDSVRGFATNVSNYNADEMETTYAHRLSRLLGGTHAVIDTGRNGAGSNGEWCNPSGRLAGPDPGTIRDEVIDENLWIKPPGESDGECNGGPAAGTWWDRSAVELTREAVS